jgi:hypothetical protein
MTDEQLYRAIAHGNHLIATQSSVTKLELVDEVNRLRKLVADLWRGGQELLDCGSQQNKNEEGP